eukprot:TRINITY_DN11174_c0_g1_i1.p1 TRINITY_DN11174_c0_g1~~TRINITY_DN11174_c0_g1_i1.p1  ORF type:complete len:305 (-),score=69.90 TRINITY_DN11174_c0_g1_i1:133-1047(-)
MEDLKQQDLIVFVHGLQGTPQHGLYIQERLHAEFPSAHVHLAEANNGILKSFFSTGDGVEAGGKRLFQEVQKLVTQDANKYRSISFIGSSFGGVYSRYCIGLLEDDDFLGLKPLMFATLATPHQGVCGAMDATKAYWASWMFPQTTKDLMLDSNVFLDLALPEGNFHKGLARFELRIAYGSSFGDDLVPFSTAVISNLSQEASKTKFEDVDVKEEGIVLEDSGLLASRFTTDDMEETYFAAESEHKRQALQGMHRNLASLPWTRVAVWLSHKHIACPFPSSDVSRAFLVDHLLDSAKTLFSSNT